MNRGTARGTGVQCSIMPRATSNVSMRSERPIKDLRRRPVDDGETDESNRVPGASGTAAGRSRRPGRAAALPSTSPRSRSTQRRRSASKTHATTPRDNPAKSSRGTGKNRGRKT